MAAIPSSLVTTLPSSLPFLSPSSSSSSFSIFSASYPPPILPILRHLFLFLIVHNLFLFLPSSFIASSIFSSFPSPVSTYAPQPAPSPPSSLRLPQSFTPPFPSLSFHHPPLLPPPSYSVPSSPPILFHPFLFSSIFCFASSPSSPSFLLQSQGG